MTRSHNPLRLFAINSMTDHWSSITVCRLLWYTLSLQDPHRNKSSGRRSGERCDHGKVIFMKIMFPPNNLSTYLILAVSVWGVAPPCCYHWLLNRRSWRRCNNHWKMSITLRYRSCCIVRLTPCSWNPRELIIPFALKARHAVPLPP